MSRVNIVIMILGLGILGTMWARVRGVDPQAPSPLEGTSVESQVKGSARAPTAAVPTIPPPLAPVASETPAAVQPFEHELQSYAELKRRVFLLPGDQARKESLLKNADVLRGMRTRLMKSPVNGQQALAQNAAIDMLLEALKTGDSEVAAEVLKVVVSDGQVEDTNADPLTRENLAGVKAEVLFHWSALKPTQSDELAQLLPGPVSQRIWANVVSAQQSNLGESAALGE